MPFTLKSAVYDLTSSFRAGGASPPYYAGRCFGTSSETGFEYAGSGSLGAWWRLNQDISSTGNAAD
ncbi:hypothetical protein CL634_08190, partial [bacterium]|nr:hypothetical protein [bacterium]